MGREQSWEQRAQAATSIAALGALVITAVSLYLTSRQSAEQNSIAEQGQITQRYTAAINQLGSNVEDVRLGGIYALQRIMRNSSVDQPTIVSVLSAFVQDHNPGHPHATSLSRPPAGVAAALTVLGSRDAAHDGYAFADLRNLDLSHMDLDGLRLANTNLTGGNLAHVNLIGADLTGAELVGAKLSDASLSLVRLQGALLIDADLTRAHLLHANLTHALLYDANLTGANLTGANVTAANLTNADLTGANLTNADLTGANLTGAKLARTVLCVGTQPTKPALGYSCSDAP